MKNVRFGLAGYGAWGSHHAKAIQETPGCELRAVCARSEESRARARTETGAKVAADFRELVANPEVDVVDIAVPNSLHEAVALAALESGKHVLLEKPMATSIEACDRIVEAARRSGRLLLVGHEMRFSPLYARMQEVIRSGQIGTPRYTLMDLWRRPYRPGADQWRMDPARVGNWTLEEPVHFFDLASWFMESCGPPTHIFARGASRKAAAAMRPEMVDHFTAIVGYADGAYATISQTLAAIEHHFSVKVFGSGGLLRAEWHAEMDRSVHPAYSLEVSRGEHLERVEVAGTPGEYYELRAELASLARAIRDGAPLPITPAEGRRAVALCLEAQRSLETGNAVGLHPGRV